MGELLSFGRFRKPNVDPEAQVKTIVTRGLLRDFEDAQKVYMKPDDYDSYAIIDDNRNVLNIIAVPSGKTLDLETINRLEEHYSSPDNSAVCVINPAPEVVRSYWVDAASMLDA
jgi:hypothetical protein